MRNLIQKKLNYNKKHGIIQRGIEKAVIDILEVEKLTEVEPEMRRIAESSATYAINSPKKLGKQIKALEKQMYTHAENLEFEQAALIRDQIKFLREKVLEVKS